MGVSVHGVSAWTGAAGLKRFAPLAVLLAGIGLSGRVASGQVFVKDTFTGTNGTTLASHAPDTGGTWAPNASSSTINIQGNQAENAPANSNPSLYVNSAAPSNAAYVVEVTGYWPSGGDSSTYSVGVVSRASTAAGGGDPDRYQAYLDGGGTLTLGKRLGSAASEPSSCGATVCTVTGISLGTAPFSHTVSMLVTGTASPVTIYVYVDGVLELTATDSTSPLTSAGYAGIRMASPSGTTTLLADNFLASSSLQLAITSVSPVSPAAGAAFSVTVQAQVNGTAFNVVNATNVSLSRYTGTGTLGGTLTGTIAAGSSSVTITGVTYTKAESGVALTATETGGDPAAPGNSAAFTVQVGTAALLVFTTLPSTTGTSGTAWGTQPAVTVEDVGGNIVAGYGTQVTLAIATGTGTLSCTTNPATPVLGVATFAGCSLDKATTYTLTASSGTIGNSTTNPSIAISAGTANKLAFLQQPSNAAETVAISPAVTVQILDQAGNLTTSTASVTLAIGTNPGGGTLSGGGATAAVSGTATFSGLSINNSGVGYTLTASSGILTTATSNGFNITGARYSVATGNWNATGTWSKNSGGTSGAPVPTAVDAVTIERGYTVTVNVTNAACASMQLGSTNATTSGTLTFAASGSPALTVTGAVNIGSNGNAGRAGIITFTSGSTLTAGSLTLGGPAGTPAPGTITMTAGGTLSVGGAITVQTATGNTWTPGTGTVALTAGSTLPATIFSSFNNLTIGNSAAVALGQSTTVGGTLTLTSGTFTVGANTLTLNGPTIAGTPANLATTASSSLVFGGSSASVVIPTSVTALSGLTINNANGVTLQSSPTLSGTLTLTSGTFTVGANTLTLNGPTIAGTPANLATTASSSLAFGGSSGSVVIPTSVTALNNLTISNASGVTLQSSPTLSGTLALTSGALSIGAHTLTLNGTISTTSGSLTGGASSNITFGGSATTLPAVTLNNLTINSGAYVTLGGAVSVSGTTGVSGTLDLNCTLGLTGNGALNVSGAFVACNSASAVATAAVSVGAVSVSGTFDYVGTGTVTLGGNFSNSGDTRLWGAASRASGVPAACGSTRLTLASSASAQRTWSGAGTFELVDISATYQGGSVSATCYGCTGASSNGGIWPLTGTATSCGSAPTLVSFGSFSASPLGGGVLLKWQSGREVSNIGFHVYRDGVRLTSSPVAGSALLARAGTVLPAGNSYSWFDPQGNSASTYTIEDLDLTGVKATHGPVYVGPAAISARNASRPASGPVTAGAAMAATASPTVGQLGRAGSGDGRWFVASAVARPPVNAAGSAASQQYALAGGQAIKLSVQQQGWYHVDVSQLTAAGMPAYVSPNSLRLFVNGAEQEISVLQQNGLVSGLEFYGMGADTTWTNAQVYWLTWGSNVRVGQRVGSQNAKAQGTAPTSFPFTTQWKPRTEYFAALINGDTDNFFGPALDQTDPVTQILPVNNLAAGAPGISTLQVKMQGVSAGAHLVTVQLNGNSLGNVTFNDQQSGASSFTVQNATLAAGATLTLATQGASDVTLVDTVTLTYPHAYAADSDTLQFTAPPGPQISIAGFSNNQIRVVDVTDPAHAIALAGTVTAQPGGAAYSIAAVPQGEGTRTLLAFTSAQMAQPAGVEANQPSSWHSAQAGADMVIVSHANFIASLAPLAALRQSQGLKVAVVDVEDLYDEFNYGSMSPYAVKNFLANASAAWTTKPRWVLLVGDGTDDPRNYFGTNQVDYVPVEMVATSQNETASDDWFADFANVGVPQMAVGRLPVDTAGDADALVAKIVAYDKAGAAAWKNRALVVAGTNDSDNNFENYAAAAQAQLPGSMAVTKILQASDPNPAVDFMTAFNSGPGLVDYSGHGSTEMWDGDMLTSDAASGVANGAATPFVISMTCLNGYFQDVWTFALAKALLEAPGGGAVGVWASSGLTNSAPQATLNQTMLKALYGGAPITVGEAAMAAKKAASDPDVQRTWILFADPSMRLR